MGTVNYSATSNNMKLVHCLLTGGCYIWYSEEGTGQGRSPPRPLLAVPNITAHPSTTVYQSPYCCIVVRLFAVLMYPWRVNLNTQFQHHGAECCGRKPHKLCHWFWAVLCHFAWKSNFKRCFDWNQKCISFLHVIFGRTTFKVKRWVSECYCVVGSIVFIFCFDCNRNYLLCGLWLARASVYLNNVYYRLDVVHRAAIVNSHGVVVGHLQVAVKLLSS